MQDQPAYEKRDARLGVVRDRVANGDSAESITGWLCDELDTRVRRALDDALQPEVASEIQVVAVGGYGRREVYPHVDVDLLFLYDDAGTVDLELDAATRLERSLPGASAQLAEVQRILRDRGMRVAASTRSLREQRRCVVDDVTIAAASLDARTLAGAELISDPRAEIRRRIDAEFDGGVHRFCQLILDGLRARHERFGGSAYMLEPQVKMGRGGLRDSHAVRWAAQLSFGSWRVDDWVKGGRVTATEGADFSTARDFISRVRLALHATSRFKNDRLAFERKATVARLLGFGHGEAHEAIESFMQVYYRHAETLANLAERWLTEWTASEVEVQPLDDHFGLRGELLVLTATDVPKSVSTVRDILERARSTNRRLDASTRSFLRDTAEALHPKTPLDPDARAALGDALFEPEPDAWTLRALMDLGLLEKLVPEWSHIVGHNNYDVYHVYTTDRHLLESYRALARALTTMTQDGESGAAPSFVQHALQQLLGEDATWHEPLCVATLLHDVGKGLGGDHSLIGAGMAYEVCRRLELSVEQSERARWLVLEHLRMAKTSQRRDVTDGVTVQIFARAIPSPSHLNALAVLTWCDMSSVAPQGASSWKVELLRELYDATHRLLLGQDETAGSLLDRASVARLQADGLVDHEFVEWLQGQLEPRQWAALPDDELERAIRCIRRIHSGEQAYDVALEPVGEGQAELLVCADDRPRLLQLVTTAIAANRINIFRAKILTLRCGIVVDGFRLDWSDPGGHPLAEHRATKLVSTLESVLTGDVDVDDLRARMRSESRLPPPSRPPVPTQIVTSRDPADAGILVTVVKARDRLGLLADLTKAMCDVGVDVERSIVTTEGDRIVDTFYVRAGSWTDELVSRLEHAIVDAVGSDPAAAFRPPATPPRSDPAGGP